MHLLVFCKNMPALLNLVSSQVRSAAIALIFVIVVPTESIGQHE
jgi:hypothetical protein